MVQEWSYVWSRFRLVLRFITKTCFTVVVVVEVVEIVVVVVVVVVVDVVEVVVVYKYVSLGPVIL